MKSFFEKPTLMHIKQFKHLSTYITYITFKHFISITSIQHNKPHMASQSTRLRLIHNPVSLLTFTIHTRPQTLMMLSSNHPTTSSFHPFLSHNKLSQGLIKRGRLRLLPVHTAPFSHIYIYILVALT